MQTAPITRQGVAAALADGTMRIVNGKLHFYSEVAEQLADRQLLLDAEQGRVAYAEYQAASDRRVGGHGQNLLVAGIRAAARLGLDNEQLARWLDVDVSQVNRCWTAAPTATQRQARELFAQGFGVQEVSRQLGVNKTLGAKLRDASGISPKPTGTVPAHVLDELDKLLGYGKKPLEAHTLIVERWPEMVDVLTLNNCRVRLCRLKKRQAG